jgi:hypothetical protein
MFSNAFICFHAGSVSLLGPLGPGQDQRAIPNCAVVLAAAPIDPDCRFNSISEALAPLLQMPKRQRAACAALSRSVLGQLGSERFCYRSQRGQTARIGRRTPTLVLLGRVSIRDVRLTPNSGAKTDIARGPRRAKSGYGSPS